MNEEEKKETEQAPPGKRYVYVPVRSAIPLWCAVIAWVICALLFPLYKIGWLIFTAVAAFLTWLIARGSVKEEKKRIEVPFTTGIQEIDEAVRELDRVASAVEEYRLTVVQKFPETSEQMSEIVSLLGKIAACLAEDAEDLKRCRRFMNYYLPTTEKLAEKYAYITTKDEGENVNETRRAIESAFVQIRDALKKQYDALFANDALDITTDVTVLETMLKKDGLNDEDRL